MTKIKRYLLLPSFLLLFGCSKKNSPYKREGSNIFLGTYPQTLEVDSKTIEKLNKYIPNLPTIDNSYNWTSYKYFILDEELDYMFYIDIDLDNDNIYDYRGVYFNRYIPYDTHESDIETHAIQLYNDYYINTVYFFKYEPIKWNILEENDESMILITDTIIDTKVYYPSYSKDLVDHEGLLAYANNYELSTIRKWLNKDFYDSSFNTNEKEIIEKTLVNNSTSRNDYIENYKSNDTLDYVYLLSNDEVVDYYKEKADRLSKSSDYAKIEGLNQIAGIGIWQTRSPYSSNPNYTLIVNLAGTIIHTEANSTFTGIRPVIVIKK